MDKLRAQFIRSSLIAGLVLSPLVASAVVPLDDAPAMEALGRVDVDGFGGAPPISLQSDSELTPPFARSLVSVADAQAGFFAYSASADIGNLALRVTGSMTNDTSTGYGNREVPILSVASQVLDVITLSSPSSDPYEVTLQLEVDGIITSTGGTDSALANALVQMAPVGLTSVTDSGAYGIGLIDDTLEVTRTFAGTSVDIALNAFLSFNVFAVESGSTATGDLGNTAFLRLLLPQGVTISSSASGTFAAPIPIPEPQTWALWLGGLGLLGWVVRRRRA
jgi:MYXO-CTERM domain-containing protein